MCACAGSSTDRTTSLSPASPRNRPDRRKSIFKHFAGQVRMDLELGRIGFMSTQRREDHSTPATKTCRRGPRYRWQRTRCTDSARASGHLCPGLAARNGRANASVGTAPPFYLARLATNSLQSDYRTASLVRPVPFSIRQSMRSSPPTLGAESAASGRQAMHGSSLRHTPIPPGFASLHPPLP
jgi:hypothetical protein